MSYTSPSTRFFFTLLIGTFIVPLDLLHAHDTLPTATETKNNSLGWGTAAVGIYTVEKTGRVLQRVAKNQSIRWVIKNPVRAGALATTLLIGCKRPHSFRATLALIAHATGTTLHASAKITRGMSFAQAKLGDGLQWSGKRLLQNSSPVVRQTSEIRIPFRRSDGTIEEIIHNATEPIVTVQQPASLTENVYSLYHMTA